MPRTTRALPQFEELGGALAPDGEVIAPHESPLAVAGFVVDDTRAWLHEQAGGLDARGRLQQAGVALDPAGEQLSANPRRAERFGES